MPSPPTRPNQLLRRLLAAIGVAASATIAASITVSTTHAAFGAETSNTINVPSPDTVNLDEDSSVARRFAFHSMAPGEFEEHCIAVAYAGPTSAGLTVRMYVTSTFATTTGDDDPDDDDPDDDDPDVARHLDITIEEGTGATFNDCSGFLPTATLVSDRSLLQAARDHSDFASGVGTFVPTSTDQTVSYRIILTATADSSVVDRRADAAVEFGWAIDQV